MEQLLIHHSFFHLFLSLHLLRKCRKCERKWLRINHPTISCLKLVFGPCERCTFQDGLPITCIFRLGCQKQQKNMLGCRELFLWALLDFSAALLCANLTKAIQEHPRALLLKSCIWAEMQVEYIRAYFFLFFFWAMNPYESKHVEVNGLLYKQTNELHISLIHSFGSWCLLYPPPK